VLWRRRYVQCPGSQRETERESFSLIHFPNRVCGGVGSVLCVCVRARGLYSRHGSLFFLAEIRILYALLWLSVLQIAREFLRVVVILISLYMMAEMVPINQEYTVAVQISNIPATDWLYEEDSRNRTYVERNNILHAIVSQPQQKLVKFGRLLLHVSCFAPSRAWTLQQSLTGWCAATWGWMMGGVCTGTFRSYDRDSGPTQALWRV
jgi:hypothetical protein